MSGLFDRNNQHRPIPDVVSSLEAAGIRLKAVRGKLDARAPEGKITRYQHELLTRCEGLIAGFIWKASR